jgi:putative CRISPR-associated protein (TIGR02619 family)
MPQPPFHRVVLTSGTSAFTGKNRFARWAADGGLVRVEGPKVHPPGDDPELALERLMAALGHLPPVAPEDLRTVSAECAVVHALRTHHRLAHEPEVVIVCSDTFGGVAAARLVERVLARSLGARVKVQSAPDLDAEARIAFVRSLGRLMAELVKALGAGMPDTTCFAPIGGYKVMTALGYVAGSTRRYPMAYVHEDTQVLHVVPPIPVQLDPEIARQHRVLFRSLAHGPRELHELAASERRVIAEHPFFFEQAGSLVDLGAFGVFALEQSDPSALRPRVFVTNTVQSLLERGHEGPFVAKQLSILTQQLLDPTRHRGVLRHEVTFGVHDSEFSLFKGASGAAGVFRCVYRSTPEHDIVVARVWLDHARYEAEARAALERASSSTDATIDATPLVFRS